VLLALLVLQGAHGAGEEFGPEYAPIQHAPRVRLLSQLASGARVLAEGPRLEHGDDDGDMGCFFIANPHSRVAGSHTVLPATVPRTSCWRLAKASAANFKTNPAKPSHFRANVCATSVHEDLWRLALSAGLGAREIFRSLSTAPDGAVGEGDFVKCQCLDPLSLAVFASGFAPQQEPRARMAGFNRAKVRRFYRWYMQRLAAMADAQDDGAAATVVGDKRKRSDDSVAASVEALLARFLPPLSLADRRKVDAVGAVASWRECMNDKQDPAACFQPVGKLVAAIVSLVPARETGRVLRPLASMVTLLFNAHGYRFARGGGEDERKAKRAVARMRKHVMAAVAAHDLSPCRPPLKQLTSLADDGPAVARCAGARGESCVWLPAARTCISVRLAVKVFAVCSRQLRQLWKEREAVDTGDLVLVPRGTVQALVESCRSLHAVRELAVRS
jgi:hypothetical protein